MFTIIVPVYNEENTILSVLVDLDDAFYDSQVIVIDNNSTDTSHEIVTKFVESFISQSNNKFQLHNCHNPGKSNAIRSALHLVENSIVILHDADNEYRVGEALELARIHISERSDMTIGVRSNKLLRSIIANTLIRFILKIRYKKTVSDILTGSRVVSRELLLQCVSEEFALETELTKLALKQGLKIIEGPCYYKPRIEGKKIKAKHMIELLRMAIC